MKEVMCCAFCGRDTTNKCGVCKECNRGIRRHTAFRGDEDEAREAREVLGDIHHTRGWSREHEMLGDVYDAVCDATGADY